MKKNKKKKEILYKENSARKKPGASRAEKGNRRM